MKFRVKAIEFAQIVPSPDDRLKRVRYFESPAYEIMVDHKAGFATVTHKYGKGRSLVPMANVTAIWEEPVKDA